MGYAECKHGKYCGYDCCVPDLCNEFKPVEETEVITLAEDINVPAKWIPVTDRLPEKGLRVLATDGAFVGEMYLNERGQWRRYNVNSHELLMALDILYWTPMPEPPKEERYISTNNS